MPPLSRSSLQARTRPRAGHVGGALLTLSVALATALAGPAYAQSGAARVLIPGPIDGSRLVRLRGNTRPEANARDDRGRVPDALPMAHMQLLLKRAPERERALEQYLAELHDRASPSFHRWLTSAQLAQRFGLAQQDLATLTAWLRRSGFIVNTVYPSTGVIDFSGTAGTVRKTFHCEIHYLEVRGERHVANMSDPQIPAALAPAVAGVISLSDFRPHTMRVSRAQYSVSGGQALIAPADVATIYNLNPLFAAGDSGQNQTVVVIEDTDVYSTADWTTFRNTFGLSAYSAGTFTEIHPAPASGSNNCRDPHVVSKGVDAEAILDAEWASAAAPSAAIELASCADSGSTFGGLIALENLLNQSGSPPAIVSISYGECEAENGAAANAAYVSVYQQAVAEGVSVFVAAGDDGAASCDAKIAYSSHGLGVSGFASTPYDVAVGGTDFGDTYAGTEGDYWSSNNTADYGSALSYVPEIPWNDSCAGSLLASFEGYDAIYGTNGFCNSSAGSSYLTTDAGSGGASGCASGAPSTEGVVGGTCAGTAKPSWQSGVPGIPQDGVRDLPDVSLFAANGLWKHYYVFCWSNTAAGGAACSGAPSSWSGGGGTSFSAPIFAGIQALVNQSVGSRQGNPNDVYYPLAASQVASGLSCDSTDGNGVASGCVFYDVTEGDMDVDCSGSIDCYAPASGYGGLSTTSNSFSQAYGAAAGWDFATGLGTPNAYNLVSFWTSSDLSLSGSGELTSSELLSYSLTVGNTGPQTAAAVVVSATLPAGITLVPSGSSAGCTQSGQTLSCAVGPVAVGSSVPLSIVLQPADQQTVDISFTVGSSGGDLDPRNDVVATAITLPTYAAGDGPIPLWADGALGLILFGLAAARNRADGRG